MSKESIARVLASACVVSCCLTLAACGDDKSAKDVADKVGDAADDAADTVGDIADDAADAVDNATGG